MRIRSKLLCGFAFVGLVISAAGPTLLRATRDTERAFSVVAGETIPTILALEDLRLAGLRIVSSTSEFGLIHFQGQRASETQSERSKGNNDGGEGEEELIAEGHALYQSTLKRYESLVARHAHPNEALVLDNIRTAGGLLLRSSTQLVEQINGGASGDRILVMKEAFEGQVRSLL